MSTLNVFCENCKHWTPNVDPTNPFIDPRGTCHAISEDSRIDQLAGIQVFADDGANVALRTCPTFFCALFKGR